MKDWTCQKLDIIEKLADKLTDRMKMSIRGYAGVVKYFEKVLIVETKGLASLKNLPSITPAFVSELETSKVKKSSKK